MTIETQKLVLFGAGKIGRSFIGQVFSRSGYEVVFVDINRELISLLNEKKEYKVIIKSDAGTEVLIIGPVRGIDGKDRKEVAAELAGASLAALSVGQQALPSIVPVIAEALVLRRGKYGDRPLDFIIAENMRNADAWLSEELQKYLPPDYPFVQLVGLVETSIGKMVPIMTQKDLDEDPLQVFAEPYNSLIVAKKAFKNPIPRTPNLEPKSNIKAWVDRKLFIHNLGHATSAYLGYQKDPRFKYIYEALAIPDIHEMTRRTMLQSAAILMELYPGEFTRLQLEDHIDDLLHRFQNKALGDTIFRVGCDLYRKLGPEDRLVAPIRAAIKTAMPYDLIYNTLITAISFRATDEEGRHFPNDEKFFEEAGMGPEHILKSVCRLNTF